MLFLLWIFLIVAAYSLCTLSRLSDYLASAFYGYLLFCFICYIEFLSEGVSMLLLLLVMASFGMSSGHTLFAFGCLIAMFSSSLVFRLHMHVLCPCYFGILLLCLLYYFLLVISFASLTVLIDFFCYVMYCIFYDVLHASTMSLSSSKYYHCHFH